MRTAATRTDRNGTDWKNLKSSFDGANWRMQRIEDAHETPRLSEPAIQPPGIGAEHAFLSNRDDDSVRLQPVHAGPHFHHDRNLHRQRRSHRLFDQRHQFVLLRLHQIKNDFVMNGQ